MNSESERGNESAERLITLNGLSMVFPEDWANDLIIDGDIVNFEKTIFEEHELIVHTIFNLGLADTESEVNDYYDQTKEQMTKSVDERKSEGENVSLEIMDGQGEVNGIEYKYLNPIITTYSTSGEIDEIDDYLIVLIPEFRALIHMYNKLNMDPVRGSSLDAAREEVARIKGQLFDMLQTLKKE